MSSQCSLQHEILVERFMLLETASKQLTPPCWWVRGGSSLFDRWDEMKSLRTSEWVSGCIGIPIISIRLLHKSQSKLLDSRICSYSCWFV